MDRLWIVWPGWRAEALSANQNCCMSSPQPGGSRAVDPVPYACARA
jgi:hypothetical protein